MIQINFRVFRSDYYARTFESYLVYKKKYSVINTYINIIICYIGVTVLIRSNFLNLLHLWTMYDSSEVVTIVAKLHGYRSLMEWEDNIIAY